MPTLETALRNLLADLIDDEINTGAGTAQLIFETSADVEVAALDLQNPAFGAASTGTITLNGTPISDTNATAGTIEHASVYDRDGTKQFELTVSTGAADITIEDLVALTGDTVTLDSFTLTVPA